MTAREALDREMSSSLYRIITRGRRAGRMLLGRIHTPR